jgi:hypothetical protein
VNLYLALHVVLGLLAGATFAALRWGRSGDSDCPQALTNTPVAKISAAAALIFVILALWGDYAYLGKEMALYGAGLTLVGFLLQGFVIHRKLGYYLTLMGLPLFIACVGVISKLWLLIV